MSACTTERNQTFSSLLTSPFSSPLTLTSYQFIYNQSE